MPALHLDHVSFSYTSALPLFDDVTIHLGPGWTGVVGANGAGKTTLLQLITGDLTLAAGSVTADPRSGPIELVPQSVEIKNESVEHLGGGLDGVAKRWLGVLQLDPSNLRRWATLSPGERKRWQLAAALATQPDVLLLDEPTNHIDPEAREIVVGVLKRFKGIGLVVSHDRRLLDDLTTHTLHVDRGRTRLWNGSYTVASEAWAADRQAVAEDHARVRRQEKAAAKRLADERRASERRNAARKRTVRRAAIADSDARSVAAKVRHEAGAAKAGQRMSGLRAEVDRLADTASAFEIEKQLGGSVFLDYEPSPKSTVLRYEGALTAGDTTLLDHVSIAVERTDRIRITGPNGSGKSTLLDTLGNAAPQGSRLLHLPQELDAMQRRGLADRLGSLPRDERGRVLSIVALLGVNPDDLLVSDDPSPGESRKLALALGLGTNAWALLLDEPTNHFDLPAIERLEATLRAFPGAILLVTHDEHFAADATDIEWRFKDGALQT